MPLLSELYFGTELEVLEEKDKWVFVRRYLAGLIVLISAKDLLPQRLISRIAPVIEVHAEPNPVSVVITRLVSGTNVTIEAHGRWLVEGPREFNGWVEPASSARVDRYPANCGRKACHA
ncbi:MAG: hypothetical protein U0V48_11325 [Anaerolineales bacterium]